MFVMLMKMLMMPETRGQKGETLAFLEVLKKM
jgi:hypothetical protein